MRREGSKGNTEDRPAWQLIPIDKSCIRLKLNLMRDAIVDENLSPTYGNNHDWDM